MRGHVGGSHLAAVALALVVTAGTARAEGSLEAEQDPGSEVAIVEPGTGVRILMSRIGYAFASTLLRPPVEEGLLITRAASEMESSLPVAYALGRNFPNPFVGRTRIRFDLPSASRVKLEVLDIAGRVVRTLVDGTISPGRHGQEWTGTDGRDQAVAPGIYFLRVDARATTGTGGLQKVEKLLLLR